MKITPKISNQLNTKSDNTKSGYDYMLHQRAIEFGSDKINLTIEKIFDGAIRLTPTEFKDNVHFGLAWPWMPTMAQMLFIAASSLGLLRLENGSLVHNYMSPRSDELKTNFTLRLSSDAREIFLQLV